MSTVVSSPPTNPIWTQPPPSSPRKGGILLKQLPDDSTSPPTSPARQAIQLPRRSYDADGVGRPSFAAPLSTDTGLPLPSQQIKITEPAERTGGRSLTKARPASIKFAPLPDPRQHQRSLSTGRNVKLAATLGPGGERTEELQTQGGLSTADTPLRRRDSTDSGLLDGVGDDDDDAENAFRGGDDGSDDENAGGQKRLSSMLGTSWSKSTKKLFGGGGKSSTSSSKRLDRTSSIESNTSGQGAASDLSSKFSSLTRTLSPSVSRSSNGSDAADKQARLLASLSPDSSSTAAASGSGGIGMATSAHRRRMSGGSLEAPLSSSWGPNSSALSSSPASRSLVGARMLNGRAYGIKGGVEAIRKAEEDALRGPEFSEWGSVGSMGSNSRPGDEDSDDGTGISWVRKRREAREKAAAERAAVEAAAAASDSALLLSPPSDSGNSLAASSISSDGRQSSPLTPKTPSSELPSSYDSFAVSESDLDGEMARQQELAAERKGRALSHDVQAYNLPGHMHSHGHSRTPDDDGLRTPTANTHASVAAISIATGANVSRGVVIDSSDDEDDLGLSDSDDDEQRDDDDDDDDDNSSSGEDDDDRAAMDEARKTAVCAGVEVVSRHKN